MEVFFISYLDDTYNWDDPTYDEKRTDNDVEAMKVLDALEASPPGGAFDLELPLSGEKGPEAEKALKPTGEKDSPDDGDKADDSRFDGGEYWLHYFKEADPDDDLFGQQSPEAIKTVDPGKPAKHFSDKPEVKIENPAKPSKGKKNKKNAAVPPEKEDLLSAAKQSKRMRNRGIFTAAAVVGILIIGMIVIAEPWIAADGESYTEPKSEQYGGTTQLAVGDTKDISLKLGENEMISSVITPDDDVINVNNGKVTGLGEWESATITITTMEKEVPKPYQKEFKIFGLDLTKPYNSVRSYLRNLFGIEKRQEPRTEPRILHIYELEFNVKGYTPIKAPTPINLFTNDSYQMTVNHPEGMEVIFEYEGNVIEVEQTLPSEDGSVTYIAKSFETVGTGKIIAKIGFFKDNKFVTTAAIEFDVEVIERPEPGENVVFANGDYNGSVVIEEKDEETGQN